jgi:hypothetical protein
VSYITVIAEWPAAPAVVMMMIMTAMIMMTIIMVVRQTVGFHPAVYTDVLLYAR